MLNSQKKIDLLVKKAASSGRNTYSMLIIMTIRKLNFCSFFEYDTLQIKKRHGVGLLDYFFVLHPQREKNLDKVRRL